MKIVKGVGERLLPRWLRAELRPVLAFTGAGAALCTGSVVLAGRGWGWLGERLDWRERIGALAVGGYLAVYGCAHAPHVARFAVPAAIVVWCAAAWWVAPPTPAADASEPLPTGAPHAFQQWLLHLIGDRPGIHLRDLYPAMRQLPGHEGRDNAQLRAALRALDVPVRRSLRLGGVAGRSGVARADLEALPSPAGEFGVEADGDAGQTVDSPVGEQAGERLEST
jgi:hypothetical protein